MHPGIVLFSVLQLLPAQFSPVKCTEMNFEEDVHINAASLSHNQEVRSSFCFSVSQNIMKQLVEAAIKMQSAGVFHRDIKTENVLVETHSDGPRVRIIDFGCGCLIREKPFRRFAGTTSCFCFCSSSICGCVV